MLYVIVGRDANDSLQHRAANRSAHVERLRALQDAGRLILAGPFPAIDSEDPGPAGFSGSLIVAEFTSLEEAELWARADPYTVAGVYDSVDVLPFKRVFPRSDSTPDPGPS